MLEYVHPVNVTTCKVCSLQISYTVSTYDLEQKYHLETLDLSRVARILAADVVSRNTEREQDFGEMVVNFLTRVSGEPIFSGFSHYSDLGCQISRVGMGACNKQLYMNGTCLGKSKC